MRVPGITLGARDREGYPMPFEQTLTVGWRDLDANGHMANTAYLDKSVDVRAAYMASHGLSVTELRRRQVGPFAMRDELTYRREFAMGDSIRATLEVAGLSDDGSRWRLRNAFFHGDDLGAEVLTLGAWVDLVQRKMVAPEEELRNVFSALDRTPDFEVLPSLLR
jgi:acyl-CoA thioester hydrolase